MAGEHLSAPFSVVASSNQVSSQLVDETVILNLQNGTYYGLNSVGALIWSLIQQPRTLDELCAAVTAQYAVDDATCARDIIALLHDLASHSLVEMTYAQAEALSPHAAA